MNRLLPALVAFVLTVAALVPSALTLPQHGDERLNLWKAAYYGERLAHLDFSPGDGTYVNPGWASDSWWALDQPLGTPWFYAVAMSATGSRPAARPFSYYDSAFQGTDTEVPPETLLVTRLTAVALAAFGFVFVVLRLGWLGLLVPLVLLGTSFVRIDLAAAWAEGPLLFGFGLAVLSYGTRWFPLVAGITTAIKLTGLVLWPAALLHPSFTTSRLGHAYSVLVAWLSFTLLDPPAWFGGGPLFLFKMIAYRGETYVAQAPLYGSPIGQQLGIYLPTRYIWPVEFGLTIALVLLIPRSTVLRRLWGSWRPAATSSRGSQA